MRGREDVGLPIPGQMVGIPQILELMIQVKVVITLHVYLFLRQLIKNSRKKVKSSIKITFCIESKAEFLAELKTRQKMELKFVASFAAGGIWI